MQQVMEAEKNQEPYRATKLWNEVILAFRTGMPLKRHRRRIRTYENCFMGSDCASWLNCYLKNNPNFGPDVTRIQTIQLLKKFLKCHVIDCVTSKTGKTEFQDNSHLYRFVQFSPIKSSKKPSLQILLRTPLASHDINKFGKDFDIRSCSPEFGFVPGKYTNKLNPKGLQNGTRSSKVNRPVVNQIPECHVIVKKLSVDEIENIWKYVVVKRIDSIIFPNQTEDFLDKKMTCGRTVLHNVTKVSKSGVVTLLDKTDDIPHWVISAMKCLANWPNASGSGSCLPNYPGFEKDVFKVVRDFFINPQVPVVPSEFNPLILHLLLLFSKSLTNEHDSSLAAHDPATQGSFGPCAGQKTSTPVMATSDSKRALGDTSRISNKQFSTAASEGRIILDDPTVMWDYPMSACFETEFTSASPVTKVVSNYPCDRSLHRSHSNSQSMVNENFGSLDTLSTISACSHVTKISINFHPQTQFSNNYSSLSGRPLKNASLDDLDCLSKKSELPKYHLPSSMSTLPRGYKLSSRSLYENKIVSTPHHVNKQNHTIGAFPNNDINQDFGFENVAQSAVENETTSKMLSSGEHSFNNSDNTLNASTEIWTSCCDLNNLTRVSSEHQESKLSADSKYITSETYSNDQSIISRKNQFTPFQLKSVHTKHTTTKSHAQRKLNQYSFTECFQNRNVRQKLMDIFQVILLLLPPANRRQLHLLFRMIQKILKNGKLTLDSKLPMRNYLLETFLPAIFHGDKKCVFEKATMYHLVSFLVDECEVLFHIPDKLKEEAEIHLSEIRKGRIKYSLDDSCMLTYCQLISQQQYEEQKTSLSKQALMQLLESILIDKNISDKERKKRLKQFQTNHPEVYASRFNCGNQPDMKTRHKKPLLSRFISIRM